MKMEVEIVSKEFIKPSSPTPHHLRHFRLSFLDQFEPHLRIPVVLFYSKKSTSGNKETCNLLKKSLSKVLTTFYHAAGRINNNSYIDCNDEGVLFVEAEANCQLSDILRDKIASNNNYFIPPRLGEYDDIVAISQVTFFSCGGIVVSFAMSHKLGDAISTTLFVNSWAAIARGNPELVNIPPLGSTTTVFPPMDEMSRLGATVELSKEKIVSKVILFDSFAIASLRDKYTTNSGRKISSVLAVGGFLCSRFMATTARNKKYKVLQGVNLRTRMNPPLPMLSFGNYAIPELLVEGNVDDEDDDWFEAVKRMANSTRKVNSDYVAKLTNKDGQSGFLKKVYSELVSIEGVASFTFSSFQGFPLYEVDFGWGKPLWSATAPLAGKNIAFLFPTNDGSGLEAWVSMTEEDMAKFEIDNKLLRYASLYSMKIDARSRL